MLENRSAHSRRKIECKYNKNFLSAIVLLFFSHKNFYSPPIVKKYAYRIVMPKCDFWSVFVDGIGLFVIVERVCYFAFFDARIGQEWLNILFS